LKPRFKIIEFSFLDPGQFTTRSETFRVRMFPSEWVKRSKRWPTTGSRSSWTPQKRFQAFLPYTFFLPLVH